MVAKFFFTKIGIISFLLMPFGLMAQDGATYQSANNLLEVSYSRFQSSNFDKAIEYAEKGLEEANQIQDDGLSLQFKSILGNSYLEKKEYRLSMDYFLQIALLAKQEKKNAIAANGYLALAKVYVEMQAFKKSAETFLESAEFFKSNGNQQEYIDAITAVAFNYKFANEYQLAEKYFLQLIKGANGDQFYIASYHEQLSEMYEIQKLYQKAIASSLIVYKYSQTDKNVNKSVSFAKKLARYYAEIQNGPKSLEYAKIANSAAPNNVEGYRILGEAYVVSKNFDQAINTLNRTINLVFASPNQSQKPLVYRSLANAYFQSGDGLRALGAIEKAVESISLTSIDKEQENIYDIGLQIASSLNNAGKINVFKNGLNDARKNSQRDENSIQSTLNKNDAIARKNESDLTIKIAQQYSTDFVNKSRQLSSERGRQAKELKSRSIELEDTKEQNEQLRLLQAYKDSTIAANEKEVADLSKNNRELNSDLEETELERVKALGEAEAKQELLGKEQELRKQEQKQADQRTFFFAVVIGGIVLILLIILYAFYKTNQSRKIIAGQNKNLEAQQKVIKKRNMQLKKSSDHLLKSNKKLKETQLSLKSSLSKEQMMRTELESINSELKNTQVQLIHAEKMSSLGQLTAGIAHEINNPINFVLNSANIIGMNFEELKEILQFYLKSKDGDEIVRYSDTLDQEEIDDSIDIIEEMLGNLKYGADRVTEIVKGLRTFSRFDEAEIKTVDIHENIESSLLILHNKYSDHNIAIVKEFDEALPDIECYPGQLNQVFVNIINNAIDVMSDVASPQIKIGTKYHEDNVLITIADNGSGIPEEVKSKIFDPFFTTKDVGKGTGLGLSISHSIVQQHNGQISVESTLGEGTEFKIVLPKNLYNSTQEQQAVAVN